MPRSKRAPKPELNVEEGRRRAMIEHVRPEIDAGRYPIKRVPGESVVVEADCYRDNQGMRYNLLASCLALNQMKRAAELFETYPECNLSTIFAWGRVLERWLSGDLAGAKASLRAARQQNSHTEAYLRGQKRVPKPLPDAFAIGSKEEAICSADILKIAWKAHPSARAWLQAQPPAPQRNAGLRRKNP